MNSLPASGPDIKDEGGGVLSYCTVPLVRVHMSSWRRNIKEYRRGPRLDESRLQTLVCFVIVVSLNPRRSILTCCPRVEVLLHSLQQLAVPDPQSLEDGEVDLVSGFI